MQSRPGGTDDTQDRAWLDSRGLGSRRTRAWAFAVTIVAHVVGIFLYSSVVDVLRPESASFRLPSDAGSQDGLEVIRIVEIDETPAPDRPEEPERVQDVVAPEADARPPAIGELPGVELVPPPPSAAERLRPNLRDARLWADLPDEFFELSLEQQEELLLTARIVEWYDSIAAAGNLDERLADWTFTDSDGRRWGFADGRIYLGDVSLPFPLSFQTPVGQRDAVARRLFEFDEISRQSQRYLIEQTWKERAEAIRARRDRERAAARDTIRRR
jgi:hypothetical protein